MLLAAGQADLDQHVAELVGGAVGVEGPTGQQAVAKPPDDVAVLDLAVLEKKKIF